MSVQNRLRERGIVIPEARPPVANYLPFTNYDGLVHLAGQIPFREGKITRRGKVGAEFTVEEARDEARLCGLNLLANLRLACDGDLDRVERCLKLVGYVASAPDFLEQAKVMDACSELMVEVFGEAGRHARSTIATSLLVFDVPVEVEGVFAIRA